MHHPLSLYLRRAPNRELSDLAARPRLDRPEPQPAVTARLAAWRPRRSRIGAPADQPVTIRLVRAAESPELIALAVLDERRPPHGPVLLAEVEDTVVAALPLVNGPALRHPFRPTADALELLEVRRLQIRAGRVAA